MVIGNLPFLSEDIRGKKTLIIYVHLMLIIIMYIVADPRSGAFWTSGFGSGISFFQIPAVVSRILDPTLEPSKFFCIITLTTRLF
jgi:hypothetical protein